MSVVNFRLNSIYIGGYYPYVDIDDACHWTRHRWGKSMVLVTTLVGRGVIG